MSTPIKEFAKETTEVLVIGEGACANAIAHRLLKHGIGTTLISSGPVRPDSLQIENTPAAMTCGDIGTRFTSCHGYCGNFQIRLQPDGPAHYRTFKSVVVALETKATANFEAYRLTPSSAVRSCTWMEEQWHSPELAAQLAIAGHVVFLNGLERESHPAMAGRMVRLCLALQQRYRVRTYFLTGNLKVADTHLEEECRTAKTAGTIFLKFNERFPTCLPSDDGRISIEAWDETLRSSLKIKADMVVVDETVSPSAQLASLARVLKLELGPEGFLQGANVHRLTHETNRRGIFVAAGSRALLCPEELAAEPERITVKVLEVLHDLDRIESTNLTPIVTIDPLRCGKCLSCYRVCPYGAILLAEEMSVIPQACQFCGLCAAGCPAQAIEIKTVDIEKSLIDRLAPHCIQDAAGAFVPRIVVFGCERSIGPAHQMALASGHSFPENLVFVEGVCSGTFSNRHLMAALDHGADGIMVLSCHPGNCHSGKGDAAAKRNTLSAQAALAEVGIGRERIIYSTLAANMGAELACQIHDFYLRIQTLGPLSL